MYRVAKINFTADNETIDKLFECNRISAQIWNDSLELSKYYHRLGDAWISKTQLQEELKGLYPIHSQSIQNVAHKYLEAREATKKAREQGLNSKYPYKNKRHFNTVWVDKAFSIKLDGKSAYIELSLGNGIKDENGKRKRPKKLYLKTYSHAIPKGEYKEIEIIFEKNKLVICLTYDDLKEEKMSKGDNTAAIDLGEIHSISSVATNGNAIVISGREIRSINRLRNKKIKELQILMSRCKKYSNQWKKYNRAKKYILTKTNYQIQDILHKTTHDFVKWCLENEVKEVAIGKVEGVQRNTSKKNKKSNKTRSKKTNQKLSNWSFGKIKKYLEYKLGAEGIVLSEINESYTTQTCPVCGMRKKPNSRVYKCTCGYIEHRDVHGAKNILSKYINDGKIQNIVDINKYAYERVEKYKYNHKKAMENRKIKVSA